MERQTWESFISQKRESMLVSLSEEPQKAGSSWGLWLHWLRNLQILLTGCRPGFTTCSLWRKQNVISSGSRYSSHCSGKDHKITREKFSNNNCHFSWRNRNYCIFRCVCFWKTCIIYHFIIITKLYEKKDWRGKGVFWLRVSKGF